MIFQYIRCDILTKRPNSIQMHKFYERKLIVVIFSDG